MRPLSLLSVLLLAACAEPEAPPPAPAVAPPAEGVADTADAPPALASPTGLAAERAVARLSGVEGSGAAGTIYFQQIGDVVRVLADVGGLDEGFHGLRILAQTDCASLTDPRPYNPDGLDHAAPNAAERPDGALGNVDVTDDGTGRYERVDPVLALSDARSVVGRAAVVLAGQDDFATQPDGGAGAVVACGVIEPEG